VQPPVAARARKETSANATGADARDESQRFAPRFEHFGFMQSLF